MKNDLDRAGDVDEVGALQLGVDALAADESHIIASSDHALHGRRSRQIFEVYGHAVFSEEACFLRDPYRSHRATQGVIDSVERRFLSLCGSPKEQENAE